MLYEKTLENGLELVVKKTDAPVVAFQVWVDVGSIDERPEEAGFCHFLEHMLFKGTKKRTTAEIAGTIEGSGGDMNAFTSFEHTVYHITNSNTKWEISNEILSDMVLHSIFKKSEFDPEKEVILEEIKRGNDSPDRQLYYDVYEQMYGKTGYGRPVIGFPKTVKNCNEKKLKKFWEKWYSPSLMTLVVVGNVDPHKVEKKVLETWGKVKRKPQRKRRRETGFKFSIKKPTKTQTTRHYDVNSIRWSGSLPSCSIQDTNLVALDVASMILGFGESSRLHQRLFRQEKVVTAISASNWSPLGKGMFNIDVETSLDKLGNFRKILREELEKFCKDGPTKEELDRTKVLLETDRIYNAQSMDDIANRIGSLKSSVGNSSFDLEYNADVRELSAEDIRDAARKLLQNEPLRECVLLPEKMDPKEFWGKAEEKPFQKLLNTKKVEEIIHETLQNGIELLLIPRNDVPVVAIQTIVPGGLRYETRATSGISNLLSEIWEKGPHGMTPEIFSAFLENRASRIDTFNGRNSMGLTMTTTTHYMDEIIPLYIDTLMNASLDEKELSHARELQLEDIRTLEDNPARLCSKLFTENLFGDHPYSFPVMGYEDSVKSININQIRNFYSQQVKSEKMVITAVGKFNPSHLKKYFEKIQRTPNLKKELKLNFNPPKAPRVVEVKKNKEQSHIIIGFPGIRVTDSRRFTMKVLMTILSGQSGRLFREIRDKKGLCYTVSPIALEGIETGYFGIYIGTDPQKREQAIHSIHEELRNISNKPAKAFEIERAKEFLLGRHHMDMQLNSSIATTAGFSLIYGLPWQEMNEWDAKLKQVNAKAIQSLAKEIFEQPATTAIVV